jgi:hypothetical protein
MACAVPGCPRRALRVVEVDLPASWNGDLETTTLTLHVALCRPHGRAVEARTCALLVARADYAALLVTLERAVLLDASQRARIAHMERAPADHFPIDTAPAARLTSEAAPL